uniref:G protein-coupled receptor kinase interacting ArfGAP 2a n=1 Tax=Eptatretus burgeri TaxID=7764 RepID=A0A8C4Q4M9_EPTBU
MLAFVHRLPCRDDDSITTTDLSKQLHSSVRTGNLETSLRLLSLGAQASYFNPDKGSTALHVAAKAGQALQAELLVAHGADPGALDALGQTPVQCARQAGHIELAERLLECQFELTDRLTFYLCGRKPDHKTGQHFVIPQMADSSLDLSEFAKAAKKRLEALSNRLFEELAMDVYDEVDRRETDAVWLTTQNHSKLVTDRTAVPFLPVNPEYSSTRNQGRQKLARFNAREFATLVIDILGDAKRRQQGVTPGDDEDDIHDYDVVPSEDEEGGGQGGGQKTGRAKSVDGDLEGTVSLQEHVEVKAALVAAEVRIRRLLQLNAGLGDDLRRLQIQVDSLHRENAALRGGANPAPSFPPNPPAPPLGSLRDRGLGGQGGRRGQVGVAGESGGKVGGGCGRPLSLCDVVRGGGEGEGNGIRRSVFVSSSSPSPSPPITLPIFRTPVTSVDGTDAELAIHSSSGFGIGGEGMRIMGHVGEGEGESESSSQLPSGQDVIRKTEQITKNIQELLRAAQDGQHDSFVPCSTKIHVAVSEMASLFTKKPRSETLRASLRLMCGSAVRLQSECLKTLPGEPGSQVDLQLITQQVIQCAYDIAKAARQLVTFTTNAAAI